MKLHENQLRLIRHLVRFHMLDYESCLTLLDTESTGDRIALSYRFRPLTKNQYLVKSKQGIVTAGKKGRALFREKPLFACGGSAQSRERILQVSRMCALMEKNSIPVTDTVPASDAPHFIPSACWRRIAPGILSTTRFLGVLLTQGRKYAVYDIGDGNMDWQVRAESSLFYRKYGAYETRADGMLLICRDGMREAVAEKIIRQTMWNRKTLLKEGYAETDKPVHYSRSPIKLRVQYERVYLTTPKGLKQSLERIREQAELLSYYEQRSHRLQDASQGDLEKWPTRYFFNTGYDLLKLVFFFATVKKQNHYRENPICTSQQFPDYHLVMYREDIAILNMYPDVRHGKGVKILVLEPEGNR